MLKDALIPNCKFLSQNYMNLKIGYFLKPQDIYIMHIRARPAKSTILEK